MSKFPVNDGNLNIDFLRKLAKLWLREMKSGIAQDKITILKKINPKAEINLASAQWLIAKDQGFSNWQRLKSHVDSVKYASLHPEFLADNESQTSHWRCGHDIEHKLRIAGFVGEFFPYTDPLCIGPVLQLPLLQYGNLRSDFISKFLNIPLASVSKDLDKELQSFENLAISYRTVLWCEADPYDQLFLIRVLSNVIKKPSILELIDIQTVPGVKKFIGLGQLSPEVLAWLWKKRRTIGQKEIDLAQKIWVAYTNEVPHDFVFYSKSHFSSLPLLGPALKRMLLEYPNSNTGLSLTEKTSLEIVFENDGVTLKSVFHELTHYRELLPFLGDKMFYAMMRPLLSGSTPLLISTNPTLEIENQTLHVSKVGMDVLEGKRYGLDLLSEARWVGGVKFVPRKPHWALNNEEQLVIHYPE